MKGSRFDLMEGTMPWHRIDTVVFDIGNILIRFDPEYFLTLLYPGDPLTQKNMLERVYKGPYWIEFDRGTLSYEEAAGKLAEQWGGTPEEYLVPMKGWIDLKTPIEEGWETVRRCRRAGKRLWLLSNYAEDGYLALRKKFADLFELFDGATISCFHHEIKPEPAIYRSLIAESGLDPRRSLFIDDVLANVEGAMEAGINGFHMHEKGAMKRFFI